MRQYLGIDIVEISRIERAIARWGDNFLGRIYTAEELRLYGRKLPSLAARFAAKEATIKALGVNEMIYHDIEITTESGGRPVIILYGRAKQSASKLGITELAVSLSHSRDHAAAVVSGIV